MHAGDPAGLTRVVGHAGVYMRMCIIMQACRRARMHACTHANSVWAEVCAKVCGPRCVQPSMHRCGCGALCVYAKCVGRGVCNQACACGCVVRVCMQITRTFAAKAVRGKDGVLHSHLPYGIIKTKTEGSM